MPSTIKLDFETDNHIAVITIDHPPANTWNLATLSEFEDVINRVEADPDVRVVILTGGGDKCFSAGFDVTDAANSPVISPKARNLWRKIDRFSRPVIAAMNGHTLGGGLELALSCHFRILVNSPKVMIGLTELNLGIIPGWGGTQRLPRIVGRAKALEMILLSKRMNAEEALKIGMVNRLAEPGSLMTDALDLARELADRPPVAVKWVLDSLTAGLYEGLDSGLNVEADGAAAVRDTQDRQEGFAAFLEKRKPVFKGK
ncbi:MAG: enoyl-CoA hydratase-related protein [Desulfatirhabdiaceae bacterium]